MTRSLLLAVLFALPLLAQAPKTVIDAPKTPAIVIADKFTEIPLPAKLFRPEVAFAAKLGPYVAFGGKQGRDPATFTVTNLKTGKAMGTVQVPELQNLALSPDGSRIAGVGGNRGSDPILVIDVATGK